MTSILYHRFFFIFNCLDLLFLFLIINWTAIELLHIFTIDICYLFIEYQVNSQSCFSYELGSQLTSYVRILRVNYTQAMPGHEQLSESDSPVTLTSRAFTPPQVTFGGSYRCAKFEKMELFVQRIQAWCKLTGTMPAN